MNNSKNMERMKRKNAADFSKLQIAMNMMKIVNFNVRI